MAFTKSRESASIRLWEQDGLKKSLVHGALHGLSQIDSLDWQIMKKSLSISLLLLLGVSSTFGEQIPTSRLVSYVYEGYWDLKRFSEEQKSLVAALAEHNAPTNQSLWFVVVVQNSSYSCGLAYFTPEYRRGRIQKGTMMEFQIQGGKASCRHISPYSIVLLEGTKEFKPSAQHLPFMFGAELSDENLVQIVDFARSQLKPEDGPIISIRAERGELVEVSTATSRQRLAGRGVILKLGKKDGAWVIITRTDRVS